MARLDDIAIARALSVHRPLDRRVAFVTLVAVRAVEGTLKEAQT